MFEKVHSLAQKEEEILQRSGTWVSITERTKETQNQELFLQRKQQQQGQYTFSFLLYVLAPMTVAADSETTPAVAMMAAKINKIQNLDNRWFRSGNRKKTESFMRSKSSLLTVSLEPPLLSKPVSLASACSEDQTGISAGLMVDFLRLFLPHDGDGDRDSS
jgi:hypothetical protein